MKNPNEGIIMEILDSLVNSGSETRIERKLIIWVPEDRVFVATNGKSMGVYKVLKERAENLPKTLTGYRYDKEAGLIQSQTVIESLYPYKSVIPQQEAQGITTTAFKRNQLITVASKISAIYGCFIDGETIAPISKLIKPSHTYYVASPGDNKAIRMDFPEYDFTFVFMPIYREQGFSMKKRSIAE